MPSPGPTMNGPPEDGDGVIRPLSTSWAARYPRAPIGTTAEGGGRHIRTSAAAASSVAVYGERARDPFRVPDVSADFARNEQLMPRLYGPGHFTEDPYSHLVSPHGIPVDELVSVLQKEIRRSHVDNAVLAAYRSEERRVGKECRSRW